MKTNNHIIVAAVIGGLFLTATAGFSQGSLTPPGAPAATMKTLAQIEPRTDILTLPTGGFGAYSITQPGSYYLSANIIGGAGVSGIEIKTNDVTIDLGGFALIGAGGFRGIFVNGNGLQRITVRNGHMTGYTSGIDCASVLGTNSNVTVEDVQLAGFGSSGGKGITCGDGLQVRRCQISGFNGSGGYAITAGNTVQLADCLVQSNSAGILTGANSLLHGVVARANGSTGIFAGADSQLFDSEATSNGSTGISVGDNSNLGRCLAKQNGFYGISAHANATIIACSALNNVFDGINASTNSLIRDCVVNANANFGISATDSTVRDCSAFASGGLAGIYVSPGTVSGCLVKNCAFNGIYVDFRGCQIIGNTCQGNNTANNANAAGIKVESDENRIENNQLHANGSAGAGIRITSGNSGNLIIKNSAYGNGTNNYAFSSFQDIGPIITISGAITTNSPWANFSY